MSIYHNDYVNIVTNIEVIWENVFSHASVMVVGVSSDLKARNFFICRYFSFYEQLKFRAQLS